MGHVVDIPTKPWSDNPNAPKIPYSLYFQEKVTFARDFVGPILWYAQLACQPTHTHFVCSVYYRGRRRAVFPLHGRATQYHLSQRGGCQVGARVLHRGDVLVCDRIHRDELELSIPSLY